MHRWKFIDGATQVELPINPSDMASPYGSRNVVASATTFGRILTNEGAPTPGTMSFSGTILTKEHYDLFVDWAYGSHTQRRITIVDHYGRALVCIITYWSPKPKRSQQHYWAHTFDATAMVLSVGTSPYDDNGN